MRARDRQTCQERWLPVAVGVLLVVVTGSGCATAPRPVTRIVNGRVVVTRAVSPESYDHVARALLYEEEQRWEEASRELQRALPFDDEAAELRAHLADLFVRLGRLDDAEEQIKRSMAIAPTVEGYLAAAHVAESRHDEKAALARYREAATLALSDESADAIERTHLALADEELAALDVAAAYETVRTLRDSCPESVRARVELGALAWALGRLPEAEAALGEALRLEPAHVDARLMLAALLGAMGRIPEAKVAFLDALERAEDPIEIAEMFLKWLVARGDKVEAGEHADRLRPDIVDDGTIETVIRIERAAGRLDRVRAAAEQAVKKGTAPARVALLISGALIDAHEHTAAATGLLALPKNAPAADVIESRLRAAEALRESGQPAQLERASRLLDEAAAAIASLPATAAPAATTTGTGAGAGTGMGGAVGAAVRGTNAVGTMPAPAPVAVAPGTAANMAETATRDWTIDLAVARGLLDEKRGDAVRAARTLDAALVKNPDSARLLLVRAAIDERRGEWRRALAFAEKILATDPRHIEALNFHGFVSVDHDSNLPAATRRLQVAMALDPGAGGIVDSLGWAYLHAGNLARAEELLIEADRLEPGDPEILSHLADLFARQKDVVRAIATYRRAMQHEPSDRLMHDIVARLRVLESKSAAGR